MNPDLAALAGKYRTQGFCSPVALLPEDEVSAHRLRFDEAEAAMGDLHYLSKIHTVFSSALQMALCPTALDVVEALIGPDILLYNSMFIVKAPQSETFVSLHQDLTFWGFSSDAMVSMWLALTPATELSGCMHMVPGSHLGGPHPHRFIPDPNNLLYQDQHVDGETVASREPCPLLPGQASFHHGWTMHESGPNLTDQPRIGLNVHYLSPSMHKVKGWRGSALLVRGKDDHRHFDEDELATYDFEPSALMRRSRLDDLHKRTAAVPNDAAPL